MGRTSKGPEGFWLTKMTGINSIPPSNSGLEVNIKKLYFASDFSSSELKENFWK